MSEGRSSARSDIGGGVAWVVFGLVILVEALRMDRFTSMGATIYTMPGFVPGMIGAVIMLLGLVLLSRGWRRRGADLDAPLAHDAPLVNRRIASTAGLTLLYAVGLLGHMPFWLATALFVSTFTWIFIPAEQSLRRRAVSGLLTGLLTAAVVSVVFQEVFLVRLP